MRIAVGFTTGAFAACTISVFGALAVGTLTPALAWLSLLAGALLGLLAARQTAAEPAPGPRFWDWAAGLLFAAVSLRSFLWLLFEANGELFIQSRYNLGDLALHLNFIQYFASGAPFWPESPIFQGEPLRYPIGPDLFNSLLLLAGVPLQPGLVWAGLIGAGLTAHALWRWGGAFGVASLLMVGGLAGISFFHTGILADYLAHMEWKNPFLSLLVPQRAFLFALPAGLILLQHWRRLLSGEPGRLPRWVEVLLYAAMPLFSVHTFLFLSGALLLRFWIHRNSRASALRCVAIAFVPATILVWLVSGGFGGKSFIGWHPGWMQSGNPWAFWFWNFGLMIPLMVGAVIVATRERDRAAAPFVFAGAFFFLLCGFVRFSPWPWDNTKLMLWSWVAMAPFIWKKLLLPLPVWGRAGVCGVLFFTGFLSLLGAMGSENRFSFARVDELHAAEAAVQAIPPAARFVIKPDYNHPLLLLGRPVVCGYDGHLWSHGYDYGAKYEAAEAAMRGQISWPEAAKAFDFDYVFSGPREEAAYGQSAEPMPQVIPKTELISDGGFIEPAPP
ncbi:MAG TPA: hypothetical protein VIS74_02655 [Chthoniobacterales bacterium]